MTNTISPDFVEKEAMLNEYRKAKETFFSRAIKFIRDDRNWYQHNYCSLILLFIITNQPSFLREV